MLSIIVAKARNGVIGAGNTIPWHLPEDLRHFKETTQGHTIIMGRLTWESLPFRPLPKRRNIVITSKPDTVHEAERFFSLPEAIASIDDGEEVFIIGGEQLYRAAMDQVDRLIVSELDIEVEGDVFFPDIDKNVWTEMNRLDISNADIPFSVVTYGRLKNTPLVGTN